MKHTEFSEYVNQCRNHLYMMAYTILVNEADAEDAVCNAILKAYENLHQLRSSKKFRSWMLTITKNEALKIKKKRMEMPGNEQVEKLLPPVYPVYENHNEMWDFVQTLQEEYRIVIVLFYYNGLSIKDIAGVLGIPAGTVKSRLKRGREFLREKLQRKGRGE